MRGHRNPLYRFCSDLQGRETVAQGSHTSRNPSHTAVGANASCLRIDDACLGCSNEWVSARFSCAKGARLSIRIMLYKFEIELRRAAVPSVFDFDTYHQWDVYLAGLLASSLPISVRQRWFTDEIKSIDKNPTPLSWVNPLL
jgi:hypothetical protein